jgi:hypothetical protein
MVADVRSYTLVTKDMCLQSVFTGEAQSALIEVAFIRLNLVM